MRLKRLSFKGFKRFTELTIDDLPETARLIVLAGPNGSGKSSLFDGLKTWHWANGGAGNSWDESYGAKAGSDAVSWTQHVEVEFHEPLPTDPEQRKKLVYARTAFRNEADFNISGVNVLPSPLDSPRVARMIDTDASVSDNYQRLILQTIDGVYSDKLPEDMTRVDLRDRVIGHVRAAMASVFPELQLDGVGGVLGATHSVGTFYFTKGSSHGFLYKNLSAGEKAVFDLLLDAVVKAEYFDDSVWCIDEPEAHLNTRIQATLLDALLVLLPADSQMVLASHSIGFMRRAWEIAKKTPGSVAFLDMQDIDFDSAVTIRPVSPSRDFWTKTLDVALGDLASLMAPERVVLCEGRPPHGDHDSRAEFDADCYRRIFAAEFPDTDFISVGSSTEVRDNRLEAGRAIQTIASGTQVLRVIDRDLLNDDEVAVLQRRGTRVLRRRQLESYLLDDEVLQAFCESIDRPEESAAVQELRDSAVSASVERGNDPDDLKSAAGEFYTEVRKHLAIEASGSAWNAFARATLAPLIAPDMSVYGELEEDIFG